MALNEQVDEKVDGRVLWFDPDKGFGFIAVVGLPDNLFVHANDLAKSGITEALDRGEIVKLRIGTSAKNGKPCAVDIERAAA